MASSHLLLIALFFSSTAFIDGFGGHHDGSVCTEQTIWDLVRFETDETQCCPTLLEEQCYEKYEQVCGEVTEMRCDVVAWAECKTVFTWLPGKKCMISHKDFPHRTCNEETFNEKHTKKVSECKTETREQCERVWVIENGQKVQKKTGKCSPFEWEECKLVEKQVDVPTMRINCNTVANVKWAEFMQGENRVQGMKQICEVKTKMDCFPVKSNKCADLMYTVFEMKPYEDCNRMPVHRPSQKQQHQKKCLQDH
jgi:hypothetical protein